MGWTSCVAGTVRSTVTGVYDNCSLMELDDDGGRCRSFIGFSRNRPDPAG